jgi:dipeptidyl aminopeptidase/acylaminoacyl peptidase
MLRRITIAFLIAFSLATCSAKESSTVVQSHRELIASSLSPNEKAEFFWSKPAGDGPFPMIVFLHGHQEPASARIGGKAFVDWGVLDDYANTGFVTLAISQPGYGNSEGKPDFCGPRTQAAVKTVIDHFRTLKFVDSSDVAIEGISRGAVVASMVAAQDASLRAIVLIGGIYDLKSFYADQCVTGAKTAPTYSICQSIREEMPISDQELVNRSAAYHAANIKAQVLILHGAEDQNAPVEQARTFAAVLQKSGAKVEIHVFPKANHQIPMAERQPIISAFLK